MSHREVTHVDPRRGTRPREPISIRPPFPPRTRDRQGDPPRRTSAARRRRLAAPAADAEEIAAARTTPTSPAPRRPARARRAPSRRCPETSTDLGLAPLEIGRLACRGLGELRVDRAIALRPAHSVARSADGRPDHSRPANRRQRSGIPARRHEGCTRRPDLRGGSDARAHCDMAPRTVAAFCQRRATANTGARARTQAIFFSDHADDRFGDLSDATRSHGEASGSWLL